MKHRKQLWIGLASMLLAAVLFLALLLIQISLHREPVCRTVICAKADIPQNLLITEENCDLYTENVQIPVEWLPEQCILRQEDLLHKCANILVSQGSILTAGMFSDYDTYYEIYEEPVFISFPVDELYQGVAGRLRKGDLIDIYCLQEQAGQEAGFMLLERGVRIENVYTAQGREISGEKEQDGACLITIPMERDRVAFFYEKLTGGEIRICLLPT